MRILTAGTGALLVCLDKPEYVTALYDELLADPPEGFIEAVLAAETVLVVFDPARTTAVNLGPRLRDAAERAARRTSSARDDMPVENQKAAVVIPVVYDGADLEETARRAGLSVDEVVRRHTAGDYVVAFCGFAPGFGYLTGLDPTLMLPRRSVPRTRVPAGSVAISDRYTSVYPVASPGGWHILGRTTMSMWDVERQPPALLAPGTRVRFERVREQVTEQATEIVNVSATRRTTRILADDSSASAAIEILSAGPLTTIQDLGRTGLAAVGVGTSGAADRGSLRLANRLVGNPEDAAGLELTYGGLRARFKTAATFALTGAPCPASIDEHEVAMDSPVSVRAGQQLAVGVPSEGLRTYLAVRGGIDIAAVLGSRSTDMLSGIGPPVLEAGTRLPIGRRVEGFPNVDIAPRRDGGGLGPAVLRVVPGPRDDWFLPEALDTLGAATFVVTNDSNRVGARLDGPALKRRVHEELPSEGVVSGALQVPPDGRPILFLADHPVTGGYPVIAVVIAADLDRAAQLRAGDAVRFRPWAESERSTRP